MINYNICFIQKSDLTTWAGINAFLSYVYYLSFLKIAAVHEVVNAVRSSPSVSSDNFNNSVNATSSAMSCLDRQVPLILRQVLGWREFMCGMRNIKPLKVWEDTVTINSPGNHSSWYSEHPCYELMGKYLHIFYQWKYQYQLSGPTREITSVTVGPREARCHCHQYCWFHAVF